MNIASVLKSEISRLARKELKSETDLLKKASARQRSEIVALKRQVLELQRQLKALLSGGAIRQRTPEGGERKLGRLRFSAKRLAAHRQRLGMSAGTFGKLIGVSGQTIYHWESEKSRPRDHQLQAIASVRKLGKKAALAILEGSR